MWFENVYFVNGTAYAGKSTLVKKLAEKYCGIECGENYHDELSDTVNDEEFPSLAYTKNLTDWHDFIRRTPDEYERWYDSVSKECEILELRILTRLAVSGRKIFADTNISLETLKKIVPHEHVLIMLADKDISVNRFFERPDPEKNFLYKLIMEEPDTEKALADFRECLSRVNSQERYDRFKNSGFNVLLRDENRTAEQTMELAEKAFGLI